MKKIVFCHMRAFRHVALLLLVALGFSLGTCRAAERPARILAIGNSFSQDAVEQYLYELCAAEGIEVVIGNAYIGGCTLERHVNNAREDAPAYQYRKIVDGEKVNTKEVSLLTVIRDEAWDFISLQQASGFSGQYETYERSLPELAAYVRQYASNPDMKLMMHQTWAYESTSTHKAFANYDRDQMTMYKAIVKAVFRAAPKLAHTDLVIPSGTAIQNGRTSFVGDHFTRDGYHLNLDYGRYTAACAWFEAIFGRDVTQNAYRPERISEYYARMARRAAHEAVKHPKAVTTLSDFKLPEAVGAYLRPAAAH